MSDVFISYSSDVKDLAERLSECLERKGISTWTHFKSLTSSQQWIEEIQHALDKAKYFLIVIGPKNRIGPWQDREWQAALQRTWSDPNKRIIPVLVDDATPPSFLKNWVSLRMNSGKPKSPLIDELYDVIRGKDSREQGKAGKRATQPDKAFQSRLEKMEKAAKQEKSSREE